MRKSILFLPLVFSMNSYATSMEVLHWWTAAGEYESQQVLENSLLDAQIKLRNFAIVGEGGDSAIRVLQMRALSGNPPDAAQIKGPDIGEWTKVGMLEEVESIIDTSSWSKILPQAVRDTISFNGHYMAVPVNIHRVNWLWLNKKIFTELKLSPPATWDDFFDAADKIKAAGYMALAHGGTAWQDSLLFESMALSLLGPEKYKKAFVEHDQSIITSAEMIAVFEKFKRLKPYTAKGMVGKDWFQASTLLSTDKAAMQFMGDWAKGMWNASGKVAMRDYLCVDVPESAGLFSYNIDSFVLFEKHNFSNENKVQSTFAQTLLSPKFQTEFNLAKGSIPVRNDIPMDSFDKCAQKSYADFAKSELVPSFTQNLASTSHVQNIMTKIISNYFNDPNADAAKTVKRLSLALRAVN
ncbi:ABC transporter substrate-binding protein [Psychromonas ossibalaenae]|uniref:ABC transporter substrate-binding protein n=1 Tax=Psychromonas ossibalaenae TaxID=444922 RepID=UPI000375AA0B|nr:ABC transporter substrate-binding protein [Psychromonas ossibalaenae]